MYILIYADYRSFTVKYSWEVSCQSWNRTRLQYVLYIYTVMIARSRIFNIHVNGQWLRIWKIFCKATLTIVQRFNQFNAQSKHFSEICVYMHAHFIINLKSQLVDQSMNFARILPMGCKLSLQNGCKVDFTLKRLTLFVTSTQIWLRGCQLRADLI